MKPSFRVAMAAVSFLLTSAVLPVAASAATVNVNTSQVLPPGSSSCGVLAVQNVVPYTQDGALQSFDVVIADTSYVAIQATVGDATIPFNYMTRWNNGDGTLKIHVDLQSTAIHGVLPVSLTLLSSPVGRPTCLTTISFGVLGNAAQSSGSMPTTSTGGGGRTGATGATSGSTSGTKPAHSTSTASSSVSVVSPVIGAGMQRNLERACAASGAFQLWFVLLALFAVIVILAAIAQPPLADRSPALPLSIILVPLVLLLAFWYFAPLCRAATWVPIILVLGAIAGLLAAFRDRGGKIAQVIQLPPAKSQ